MKEAQIWKIRKIVQGLISKYGTQDPFLLADRMHIHIFELPLGNISGFYRYMKRHRCIYINSCIDSPQLRQIILAHELGHAILHRRDQAYFMESHTLLKISRYETEANIFASMLLFGECRLDRLQLYMKILS